MKTSRASIEVADQLVHVRWIFTSLEFLFCHEASFTRSKGHAYCFKHNGKHKQLYHLKETFASGYIQFSSCLGWSAWFVLSEIDRYLVITELQSSKWRQPYFLPFFWGQHCVFMVSFLIFYLYITYLMLKYFVNCSFRNEECFSFTFSY